MTQKTLISVLAAALASPAFAQTIYFQGNPALSSEGTGATYSGEMEYDSTLQELSISLTNTTPAAIGGFITALAFLIDSSDPAASATLMNANPAMFANTGSVFTGGTFGNYKAGAGVGGDFLGGGPPNGIAIGDTGSFVFNVSASDAGSLTTASFLSNPTDLLVRFRGLDDGGSDVVGTNVPTPAAAITLALAGGLVGGARRRR